MRGSFWFWVVLRAVDVICTIQCVVDCYIKYVFFKENVKNTTFRFLSTALFTFSRTVMWIDVQIDWLKEPWTPNSAGSDDDDDDDAGMADTDAADINEIVAPTIIATGKATMIADRRYRVYRPHNSALSVLIIRRARKRDAGVYRCNLSGSSTRQKYLVLNVTGPSLLISLFHKCWDWCQQYWTVSIVFASLYFPP